MKTITIELEDDQASKLLARLRRIAIRMHDGILSNDLIVEIETALAGARINLMDGEIGPIGEEFQQLNRVHRIGKPIHVDFIADQDGVDGALQTILAEKQKTLQPPAPEEDMGNRDTAIRILRAELKARSKTPWSVRGGTGTAWGWIEISVAPRALVNGRATEEQKKELADLFQKEHGNSSISIAASAEHRREYINRLRGLPFEIAQGYWD